MVHVCASTQEFNELVASNKIVIGNIIIASSM